MSDGAGKSEGTVIGSAAADGKAAAAAPATSTEATTIIGEAKADGTTAETKDTKVADAKADPAKPPEKAPEKPAPVEWDKWEPAKVEGLQRDAAVLKQFREVAKKHGLSAEQAQGIVELSDQLSRSTAEAELAHLEETQAKWRKSVETDKEIGGTKLKETHADIGRVLNSYGKENPAGIVELRKAMNETRMGDHPELVRFLAWVGRQTREDSAPPAGPTHPKQTLLDQLYGSSQQKS